MSTFEYEATVVSAASTRTDPVPPKAAPAVAPAARISRYVVVDTIGSGAMGTVYSAYDPQLDRRIALKLINTRGPAASQTSEKRLLREAQALAKLSHPNVVHVYDAGASEHGVFIAMELVVGKTLRKWSAATRPWAEVLAAYIQAGRGLLAAHEAGLVHRDFKPDNALVDDRDRVRVLDFGLALSPGDTGSDDSGSLSSGPQSAISGPPVDDEPLTKTGTVMGTPAYMSPEQFTARTVDARSDQFSFCVALLEAMEGRRPFEGEGLGGLAAAVTGGQVLGPPPRPRAPAWIRPVVLRGLAVDPNERYPSMRELLDALESRSRRRRLTVFAVGGLVASVSIAAAVAGRDSADTGPCQSVGDDVAEIWNEARGDQIAEAVAATDLPFAQDTGLVVRRGLDAYAGELRTMRRSSCEATLVDHTQTPLQYDRRTRCLDRRRRDLDTVVELLVSADAALLPHATELVDGLLPIARCADLEALALDVEPPSDPERREEVAKLRANVDRVRTLRLAGRPHDAVRLADEVVEAAQLLAYLPVRAEALYWRGTLAGDDGRWDDARRDLIEAAADAQESGHTSFLGSALIGLIGSAEGNEEAALVEMWGRWAQSVINRRGGDADLRSDLEPALGMYYARAGDAERGYEHLIAGLELESGDTPQNLAMAHNNVGEVCRQLGRFDEAETHANKALELRLAELGEDHPHVAMSLLNLGAIAQGRGDLERAAEFYGRSLAIYERSVGPDTLESATVHNNLGLVASNRERTSEAIEHLGRALNIRETILGRDSPVLINTLGNLSGALTDVDQGERAAALARRAVALAERHFGAEHERVVWPVQALALALMRAGDPKAALEHARRGLRIARVAFGEDHPQRGDTELAFAGVALGQADGEARDALAEAERIFAVVGAGPQREAEIERVRAALDAADSADEGEGVPE
ncbi:MAG: serine/threonine-protein kinase [Myxococcota bacterium]